MPKPPRDERALRGAASPTSHSASSRSGVMGQTGSWRRRRASCRLQRKGHAKSRQPAKNGWSSPNDCGEPAACGDAGPLDEYFWRVGVELEPPDEESKRLIDRPAPDHEPGGPELRLVGETPGRPLGRRPNKGEHDDRDKEQLPPENLGRGHRPRSARPVHPRNDNIQAIAVARAVAQRSAGQSERSRLRPKLQSTPPGPAMPLTCLPSSRSRDGIQGTSWKPRPLSIIANRP